MISSFNRFYLSVMTVNKKPQPIPCTLQLTNLYSTGNVVIEIFHSILDILHLPFYQAFFQSNENDALIREIYKPSGIL